MGTPLVSIQVMVDEVPEKQRGWRSNEDGEVGRVSQLAGESRIEIGKSWPKLGNAMGIFRLCISISNLRRVERRKSCIARKSFLVPNRL